MLSLPFRSLWDFVPGHLGHQPPSDARGECQLNSSKRLWPGDEWVTRGLLGEVGYKYNKACPTPQGAARHRQAFMGSPSHHSLLILMTCIS